MAKARESKSGSLTPRKKRPPEVVPGERLLRDVCGLIEAARQQVAQTVNSGLVTLYWHIGRRIREEILGERRAAYGKEIVYALSRELTADHGRGFGRANLFHMIRFAEVFPDKDIVYALRTQLSWTHLREIIYLDGPLQQSSGQEEDGHQTTIPKEVVVSIRKRRNRTDLRNHPQRRRSARHLWQRIGRRLRRQGRLLRRPVSG